MRVNSDQCTAMLSMEAPQYKYNNNKNNTYIIQAKNIKSTYTKIIKRYKLQIIRT